MKEGAGNLTVVGETRVPNVIALPVIGIKKVIVKMNPVKTVSKRQGLHRASEVRNNELGDISGGALLSESGSRLILTTRYLQDRKRGLIEVGIGSFDRHFQDSNLGAPRPLVPVGSSQLQRSGSSPQLQNELGPPATRFTAIYIAVFRPPPCSQSTLRYGFSPRSSRSLPSIAMAHLSYPRGLKCTKSGMSSFEIVPSGFMKCVPMSM